MVVVSCRNGKVVGYVSGTSLAAKAHVAIIQTMLLAFPPPPDCYLYGPVCVADTERGKGLAGAMFRTLQKHKNGRPESDWQKCRSWAFRGVRSDLVRRLRQRISQQLLHRLCHARGLQWARPAPGVQFLRDLLDRLELDRASFST